MTDQQHPITPPPHLRQLWVQQAHRIAPHDLVAWQEHVANQAARWGADMELEECVKWLSHESPFSERLRAARRPKLKSLAEEALLAIDTAVADDRLSPAVAHAVRRALERLQELEGQGDG